MTNPAESLAKMAGASKLTEKTMMPLSMVGAVAAAALWLQSALNDVDKKIMGVAAELAAMRQEATSAQRVTFTNTDMALWVAEFKARNPSLGIPDPPRR